MKPYPNNKKYLVSLCGDVWSTRAKKLMKTHPDNCGYIHISFYKKGKRTTRLLHRVVLETFRGPCPEGMEALHNDGNKKNNSLFNLRWGTKEENMEDVKNYYLKKGGQKNAQAKLTPHQVREVRRMCNIGLSQRYIAEIFGIDKSAISRINSRKIYRWVKETKDGD